MKKFLISVLIIICIVGNCAIAKDITTNNQNNYQKISNKNFCIFVPRELKGTYSIKKKKDTICIYDVESKKAGFGGFAFGIRIYKNPSEHATLPGSVKIGEFIDRKGMLYDVVLKYPTDVQHDYTKEEVPSRYKTLYDLGEIVEIQGVKGAKYIKNQGMKGDDLYQEILKKHITAIKERWNSEKLEQEDMSYMYNVVAFNKNSDDVLKRIGYIYYDINADGIEELIIGEIAQGDWKGIIYDIYTMVDRKPMHVVSGGSRNRYFVCDNNFISNEYSSGANESGKQIYILLENSTELYPQVSFKYDGYINKKRPFYISYGSEINDDKWENVDEKMFEERKAVFDNYRRFDYIPLNKIKY